MTRKFQTRSFAFLAGTVLLWLALANNSLLGADTSVPPEKPTAADTNSFMGMTNGATVRVRSTSPQMELNNARLLAITESNLTVATANGERFTLLKETTTIESPVTWERTSGILTEDSEKKSNQGGGGLFLVIVLLLLAAGGGAWFVIHRRKQAEAEEVVSRQPVHPEPAPAPPQPAKPEMEVIEELVENRCFGTALEKLEDQIRAKPDEFKVHFLLLKVYLAVGDQKQVDRVLRQIVLHSAFSPEQKEQARQLVPPVQRK